MKLVGHAYNTVLFRPAWACFILIKVMQLGLEYNFDTPNYFLIFTVWPLIIWNKAKQRDLFTEQGQCKVHKPKSETVNKASKITIMHYPNVSFFGQYLYLL